MLLLLLISVLFWLLLLLSLSSLSSLYYYSWFSFRFGYYYYYYHHYHYHHCIIIADFRFVLVIIIISIIIILFLLLISLCITQPFIFNALLQVDQFLPFSLSLSLSLPRKMRYIINYFRIFSFFYFLSSCITAGHYAFQSYTSLSTSLLLFAINYYHMFIILSLLFRCVGLSLSLSLSLFLFPFFFSFTHVIFSLQSLFRLNQEKK